MKKRRLFIIFGLIIIIFISCFIIYKVGNRNLLSKNKTINNILFSNVKIYKEKKTNYFSVELSTEKDNVSVESIDIIILNKSGKKITTISAYVGGLHNGENKIIEVPTNTNISKAYSVNYVVYKE